MLLLISCSTKEVVPNQSFEHGKQRRLLEIDEVGLEYNEEYFALFGTIHNDGVEYVLQNIVDSGYTYFSNSDDEMEAFIMRQSKRYVEELFPSNEGIQAFNIDTFNLLRASGFEHSIYVSSILTEIVDVFGAQYSVSYKLEDLESLGEQAYVYEGDETDRFIACATINTAMNSLEYWSTTTFIPDVFLDDDVPQILEGSLERSKAEDVAYADLEALATALGIAVEVVNGCPAFFTLIGSQYTLALIVGCCAAYTIYKSVKCAYNIGITSTLYHIYPSLISEAPYVQIYLSNKYLHNPTIFDTAPYSRFLPYIQ